MLGDIASRFGCADCDNAESIPPSDPYYTKALDQVDSSWTLDDLTSAVTRAEKAGGGWLQFTFHHVCDNCDSLAVSPSLFGQFAQWLVDRSATHNTVVRTVGDVIGGPVKPAVVASLPPAPGPGVNGIINPSLESVDSNGVPSCWQTGGYGQNSPAFHTVSPGRTGAVAEQLTMAGYVDGDAKLLPTLDQGECAPTVTPGHTYSLRGWYQSTVPTQFEVYLRNAQGDWIYWTASPWLGASTTWAAGEWTTPEIPAGTTGLSFGLNLFQNGTLVTDDYALYDTVGAPTAPDAPPQVAAPLAPPPTAAIGVPDPAQSLGHTENETPDAHAPATGEQPANGQAEPTAPPAPEAPAAPEQPAPSSPAPSSTPPEEPATPEPAPSAPTPTEPPAQQPPAVAPQVSDPATAPPATS